MAPSAAPEEQGPTLKLIVETGPTSGQIFEFKPGSRIQVGRFIRGNSIINDDRGVSCEHVLIQFGPDFHPDPACGWTVTDLDSSNGTFLNDSELHRQQPSVLSDGDVVKIGDMTSIRVKIEVNTGKARRNPRRGQSNLGAVVEDKNNLRGRARIGNVVLENEDGELGKNDQSLMKEAEQRASVRTTRSCRNKGNFDTGLDMGVIETRKATRGKKHLPLEKEKLNSVCEEFEEDGANGVAKENSGRGGDDVSSVEMVVDLETMNLGEWLDYLEVYLPKQTIDETEVMILSMRQIAQKLHEFTKEKDAA